VDAPPNAQHPAAHAQAGRGPEGSPAGSRDLSCETEETRPHQPAPGPFNESAKRRGGGVVRMKKYWAARRAFDEDEHDSEPSGRRGAILIQSTCTEVQQISSRITTA